MRKVLFVMLALMWSTSFAQKTIQERLGYPKETKLLIIHADDIGVTQTENAASIFAMENGNVNSGSIMVPCPWFPEIAAYAKAHPQADFGLHLVLTSEWKYYKWGPVLHDKVPSLLTPEGFLTDGSVDLTQKANLQDIEKELRAQIERAKQFGIDVTHLDSHMGMLYYSNALATIYIKLGREYKIPVLLTKEFQQSFSQALDLSKITSEQDILVDHVYTASPEDFKKGMKPYYINVINNLQPGLNTILLHAAYDNDEMRSVTIDHPDWGAAWRQADFDFFVSAECTDLLKAQNIKLVTWREIRDKLLRGK